MKNFILILLLLGWMGSVQSQNVIRLDELKVKANPFTLTTNPSSNLVEFIIPEAYAGQFERDPLEFVKSNFPIAEFMEQNKQEEYDSYEVIMRSKKGYITAHFNKYGGLISTYQKFVNIALPQKEIVNVYRENRGWNVIKTTHIASSRNGSLNKEFYKVKLENGNKKRNMRIDAAGQKAQGVAAL